MSFPLCCLGLRAAHLCLLQGYRVNLLFYQQESDSPQLSTSISLNHAHTRKHTQVSQSAVRSPLQDAHTLGSATHKAVNNRKWYVAEIVSVQLDCANGAVFAHSCFIFSVHVDTSSISLAWLEGFTPSGGHLVAVAHNALDLAAPRWPFSALSVLR